MSGSTANSNRATVVVFFLTFSPVLITGLQGAADITKAGKAGKAGNTEIKESRWLPSAGVSKEGPT